MSAASYTNKGEAKGAPGAQVPLGALLDYAGAGDPGDPNFKLADGRALSRTTYAALFTLLGTTHGAGDGSTTFNIPDLRGRTAVGPDNMGTTPGAAGRLPNSNRALGQTGGEERHTLVTGEIPAHTHTWQLDTGGNPTPGSVATSGGGGGTSEVTGSTGGGGGHNNMQPYQVLNKIIRVA